VGYELVYKQIAHVAHGATRGSSKLRIPATSIILAIAVAVVSALSARAQNMPRSSQPTQVSGLVVVEARRTTVEGTDGIEITFDKASAERLLQFTHDAVGRRMIFFLNRRKLATLRLLDPIKDGNVVLTGDLDRAAVDKLFSGSAVIDVELE
jgi:hypothetical protein